MTDSATPKPARVALGYASALEDIGIARVLIRTHAATFDRTGAPLYTAIRALDLAEEAIRREREMVDATPKPPTHCECGRALAQNAFLTVQTARVECRCGREIAWDPTDDDGIPW